MDNDKRKEAKKIVGVVLLAAGNSKRYQAVKLLELIGGKKMYRHILELTADLTITPKVIVTQYEEIRENALQLGFEVVMNSSPELGISHSIQLGLRKALESKPDLDGVLFSVCDQPYMKQATLLQLLEVFQTTDRGIACIAHNEELGNPCIIGKKYFDELFALSGDNGGKKIINKYQEDVEPVFINNGKEMTDIDYKEDII
jgi:CTP:molybdopterin cytidylyltransferase MocA